MKVRITTSWRLNRLTTLRHCSAKEPVSTSASIENTELKMPTTEPSGAAFWLIPTNVKQVEKPANKTTGFTASKSKFKDEIKFVSNLADLSKWHWLTFVIRVLETGFFADCTVACGDQTWSTHKVILSRCPYFACAFSSKYGFKVCTGQIKATEVSPRLKANC